MMADPGELVTALRRTLGMHWAFDSEGDHLRIRHQARGASYRPRRRPMSWDEMLTILAATFAEHGIAQAPPLPLRWNRETDFTISAIQALDPHLNLDPPAILFGIRGSACEDALWPGKMTVGKASVPQAERAPGKCISGRPPRTPIWYLTTRT